MDVQLERPLIDTVEHHPAAGNRHDSSRSGVADTKGTPGKMNDGAHARMRPARAGGSRGDVEQSLARPEADRTVQQLARRLDHIGAGDIGAEVSDLAIARFGVAPLDEPEIGDQIMPRERVPATFRIVALALIHCRAVFRRPQKRIDLGGVQDRRGHRLPLLARGRRRET